MILLAKIPGLLRPDFHAALAVDNDDGSIGSRRSFFRLSDKIKVTGGIQDVDLHIAADNRRDRGADRELPALLLFIKITEGIPVGDISQSGRNAGQISHGLQKAGLTRSAVAKQHNIADFVSVVNFHEYHPPFT